MSDTGTENELEQAREGAKLRGRFALFGDGSPLGWTVAYATDLCDRCADCGCGTQQPVLSTAAILKDMARSPLRAKDAFRAFMGRDSEVSDG